MIHPTAIIHPQAQVDPSTRVGAYAIIDENVTVGPECVIGPQVHLTGHTTIGARNRFHTGCVIGDAPQDLKYHDDPTRLRIGDDNVFREHVTVHRANRLDEDTRMGSHCFLMANAHVGHNAQVGSWVIIANGALLAGHVTIQDRAFISGNCLIHQFVRVGTLALMQGGSAISKDLPPFTIARGDNGMCGLNTVGLRRAGLNNAQRLELRKLYHHLFRSHRSLRTAMAEAQPLYTGEHARIMLDFLTGSRRGVVVDKGTSAPEPE